MSGYWEIMATLSPETFSEKSDEVSQADALCDSEIE